MAKEQNHNWLEYYDVKNLSFQKGGVAVTKQQQHEGLNNPLYDMMTFPLSGKNEFRGLDTGLPVKITDEKGKTKVLKGPQDIDTFQGNVYERRMQGGGPAPFVTSDPTIYAQRKQAHDDSDKLYELSHNQYDKLPFKGNPLPYDADRSVQLNGHQFVTHNASLNPLTYNTSVGEVFPSDEHHIPITISSVQQVAPNIKLVDYKGDKMVNGVSTQGEYVHPTIKPISTYFGANEDPYSSSNVASGLAGPQALDNLFGTHLANKPITGWNFLYDKAHQDVQFQPQVPIKKNIPVQHKPVPQPVPVQQPEPEPPKMKYEFYHSHNGQEPVYDSATDLMNRATPLMRNKMQQGGSYPEANAPQNYQHTQWNYAQPIANKNNPNYIDYGNMYTVDKWSGLYEKPDAKFGDWSGFGKSENLITNQSQAGWPGGGGRPDGASPYSTPLSGKSETQQSNWHTNEDTNYSIDSVRKDEGFQYGGAAIGNYDFLDSNENSQVPSIQKKGKQKINRSDYLPHPIIKKAKSGGWLSNY